MNDLRLEVSASLQATAMGTDSILVQEGDELMVHYLDYTEKSVAELHALADQLNDHQEPASLNEEMHAIAHNIRGMGSSFGFPLMTQVGSTLCSYLRPLADTPASIEIVTAHLKAMDTILKNRILGEGGEEGQALITRLDEITSA